MSPGADGSRRRPRPSRQGYVSGAGPPVAASAGGKYAPGSADEVQLTGAGSVRRFSSPDGSSTGTGARRWAGRVSSQAVPTIRTTMTHPAMWMPAASASRPKPS